MILKPQDVLFLLKLVSKGKQAWSYNELALELGMSASEIHASAKRTLSARLSFRKENNIKVNISSLTKFLLNGIAFVFVPEQGALCRGMPTAYAAKPMNTKVVSDNEPPPVWPDPEGEVRGMAFTPLYKSVPLAAKNDEKLYELLVIVDSLRVGSAREKKIAEKELMKHFKKYD